MSKHINKMNQTLTLKSEKAGWNPSDRPLFAGGRALSKAGWKKYSIKHKVRSAAFSIIQKERQRKRQQGAKKLGG